MYKNISLILSLLICQISHAGNKVPHYMDIIKELKRLPRYSHVMFTRFKRAVHENKLSNDDLEMIFRMLQDTNNNIIEICYCLENPDIEIEV